MPKAAKKKNALILIGDVMSSKIVALSPHDTVKTAAKKMESFNIGSIVIVERNRLVGILSERDIATKIVSHGRNPSNTKVATIMTKKLFTARKTDLLTRALRLMHKKHIRHLPVIEGDNKVIGIVSIRDLFINYEELIKSLVAERTKALNALSKRFERYSNVDPLTGLYNYRFFNNYLDTEIARSSRRGHDFSLMFIDIDNFKNYNDTYGHAKGNQLLKEVGELLKPVETGKKKGFTSRKSDVAVRLGGDEFVMILPETNKQGALICADRLRMAIDKNLNKNHPSPTKKNLHLSVSIGISSFPIDADNKKDIIEKADQALYQAKRLGRNRVCLYEESRFDNIAK